MKIFLSFLLLLISLESFSQSVNELFEDAKKDIEADNPDAAIVKLQKIDSIRPHHPAVLKQLLSLSVARLDTSNTLKYLQRTILMNGDPELLKNSEYSFMNSSSGFGNLMSMADELASPLARADTAFLLADNQLHPEAIAHDSKTGNFYISSIHQRKIVKISPEGRVTNFCTSPILWAVSGLAVNSKDKSLWATTCAIAEMENFEPREEGNCRLLKISLETGQITQSFVIGGSEKHHWGDLVIATNGNIYISDSAEPVIYKLKKGSKRIEEFKRSDEWLNLQGLCFSADNKYLYISDYIKGLYRIDTADPSLMIRLNMPGQFLAKGIDGLYFHDNSLIAIQNGVQPFRVAKLTLNKTGDSVDDFEYLEKATPHLGEPTLGTIAEDRFYFIANSPWGYYEEGTLNTDKAPDPLVLKIGLK